MPVCLRWRIHWGWDWGWGRGHGCWVIGEKVSWMVVMSGCVMNREFLEERGLHASLPVLLAWVCICMILTITDLTFHYVVLCALCSEKAAISVLGSLRKQTRLYFTCNFVSSRQYCFLPQVLISRNHALQMLVECT